MKLFTVQEAAKLLGIGSKQLFQLLREQGFLSKANLPFNQFLASGLFQIQHSSWIHPRDGLQYTGRTMLTLRGVSHIDRLIQQQTPERVRARNSSAANEGSTDRSTQERA